MVTMVVSASVLLAFAGLAIDAGYLQLLKSRMQTAADAAALGGAQEYGMNGAAGVTAAAKGDAALNGFTDGAHGVTVTVNNPPATGYSTADPSAVEVIVTQNAATFFLSTVGLSSATVSARSVAKLASSPFCIYVLDPAGSGSFSLTNGVGVTSSCGLMVDSNNNRAFTANGGASLTATQISVVGNYSISNGASVSPTPTAHAGAMADPLATLQPPPVGACLQTNYSIGNTTTITIPPGTYCGGITIGNSANVTFSPGNFVLLGGGLNWGGGSTIAGDGVTIYNTFDATHPYGSIQMNNGAHVTLSAPTTGPLAGVLIFQDRSIVSNTGASLAGGAHLNLTGALYFPTTSLDYSNGVSAPYTLLVAKTISFSGGVKISSDYSSLPNGSPAKGGAQWSE